jgi:hypothetical protein
MVTDIKSSLKLAVSFLTPQQHLTGLGRFLTLKPAPDGLLDPKAAPLGLGSLLDPKAAPLGLGSLTDTRPVRRLDLSSPEREQVQPAPARVLAHLGLKTEHRCFQSRLDMTTRKIQSSWWLQTRVRQFAGVQVTHGRTLERPQFLDALYNKNGCIRALGICYP